jgi:hypothetical protein
MRLVTLLALAGALAGCQSSSPDLAHAQWVTPQDGFFSYDPNAMKPLGEVFSVRVHAHRAVAGDRRRAPGPHQGSSPRYGFRPYHCPAAGDAPALLSPSGSNC